MARKALDSIPPESARKAEELSQELANELQNLISSLQKFRTNCSDTLELVGELNAIIDQK